MKIIRVRSESDQTSLSQGPLALNLVLSSNLELGNALEIQSWTSSSPDSVKGFHQGLVEGRGTQKMTSILTQSFINHHLLDELEIINQDLGVLGTHHDVRSTPFRELG